MARGHAPPDATSASGRNPTPGSIANVAMRVGSAGRYRDRTTVRHDPGRLPRTRRGGRRRQHPQLDPAIVGAAADPELRAQLTGDDQQLADHHRVPRPRARRQQDRIGGPVELPRRIQPEPVDPVRAEIADQQLAVERQHLVSMRTVLPLAVGPGTGQLEQIERPGQRAVVGDREAAHRAGVVVRRQQVRLVLAEREMAGAGPARRHRRQGMEMTCLVAGRNWSPWPASTRPR